MSVHTIQLTKQVAATTEDVQTVIIADTKNMEILMFKANSVPNEKCTVKLIWDHGEVGETLLEIAQGNAEITTSHKVVGDGVKKLAIALDNDLSVAVFMNGFCKYEVED